MKQADDTQTQELKLDGQPIIDFDEHEAWPMPKPVEPQFPPTSVIREWIERLVRA